MGNFPLDDYYALEDPGCCLICTESEPDCLCLECKCTSCVRYVPSDYEDGGRCSISLEGERRWQTLEIEIDAYLRETDKAYLVVVNGDYIWVPKRFTKVKNHNKKTVILLPRWLASSKGIAVEEFESLKGDYYG